MTPKSLPICGTSTCRNMRLLLHTRTYASIGKHISKQLAIKREHTPTETTPFSVMETEEEQRIYDKLTVQFLERLRETDRAEEVWEDYSRLVESSLEKFDLSILSHQRLLKMTSNISAHRSENLKFLPDVSNTESAEHYERLLSYHEKQNNPSMILGLIEKAQKAGIAPTIKMYNHILRIYTRNHNMKAATKLFDELRHVKGTGKSNVLKVQPDVATYAIMIRGNLMAGQHSTADQIFRDMIALGMSPSVSIYNNLMLSLVRKGRNLAALRMFDELNVTKSLVTNIQSYRLRIAALMNSGKYEAGVAVLMDMLNKKGPRVPYPDASIWELIVQSFAKAGNWKQCVNMLELMQKHANVGALTLFDDITRPSTGIYEIVIRTCCENGQSQLAFKLLQDMKTAKIAPTSSIYNNVLRSLATSGHLQEAIKLHGVTSQQNVTLAPRTIGALVNGLLRDEKFEEALSIARSVRPNKAVISEVVQPILASLSGIPSFMRQAQEYGRAVVDSSLPDIGATGLVQIYSHLLTLTGARSEEWREVMSTLEEFRSRGGIICEDISDALLQQASRLCKVPAAEIGSLLEHEQLCPSISGWISMIDTIQRRGMRNELQTLSKLLLDNAQPSSRQGALILQIFLTHSGRKADAASTSRLDLTALQGFAKSELEQILNLLDRNKLVVS
ncbi:hypothetical protein DFS34DRAFT_628194 [Phlyctochytrium arcticum]|nr:hypothetical protein DFS34DRAFT_628194 [Phlyctochytrium arcticum]